MKYFRNIKKYPQNYSKGFTLIELLVVVVIIGILSAIVLVALGDARAKGADASIKSNLSGARSQAEVFFNTNTTNPNTYIGVCTNGAVGGAQGIGFAVLAAAKSAGLSAYSTGNGANGQATCRTDGNAWVAEVPLKDVTGFWCVDSTQKSKRTTATVGSGYACN